MSQEAECSIFVSGVLVTLPMHWHNWLLFWDNDSRLWATEARLLQWLTLLWLFVGLAVLFSASYPIADLQQGDGLFYIKRQLVWVLVGLGLMNVVVRSPLYQILRMSPLLLLILLALICVTLVPGLGTSINGASRWLAIGAITIPIQPSELIKPFLVLQSARIFGQWSQLKLDRLLLWLGVFGFMLLVILLQPNLSTAALCGITLWLLALAGGLPWAHLWRTALAGVTLAVASVGLRQYQQRRIMSFMNPWEDPMGDGYQLIQSMLAIGSGGWWGTGFGMSQQKLFYLPIQFTDFIFAVYAEEFGFLGSALLLGFFTIYGVLGMMVALKAKNSVQRLVAIGSILFLVGQSIINIGVTTGTLPTTGLPLPLFSYGGSSMVASLLCAGCLIRVARECNEAEVVSLQERRRLRQFGKT